MFDIIMLIIMLLLLVGFCMLGVKFIVDKFVDVIELGKYFFLMLVLVIFNLFISLFI